MLLTKQLCIQFFILKLTNVIVSGEDLTIEAGDLGKLKGVHRTTSSNLRNFISFYGIPYAKPTTKENRFKPSKLKTGPLTKKDVFHANEFLQLCPQNNAVFQKSNFAASLGPFLAAIDKSTMKNLETLSREVEDSTGKSLNGNKFFRNSMGKENCLVINVHTPKVPKNETENLPVIVFIHGGSFSGVWSSLFNGGRLLEKDVVLVTFNYRLGVLGFFNLGIDEAPGNAGLYDCITALQWVQRYISYFGGDPTRVTISGQSAGGALVTHLMASPLAEGLFHRVIAASGSALQEWATSVDPIPESLEVARNAGCFRMDSYGLPKLLEITKCMQAKSTSDLVGALNHYVTDQHLSGNFGLSASCPSVQSENLSIAKVLPEHPILTFFNGKQINVPLMMGATKHDGSFVLKQAQNSFWVPNDLLNKKGYVKNRLMSDILNLLGVKDDGMAIVDAIEETYLGDAMKSSKIDDKWAGLMDIFGVFFFKSMSYRNIQLHSDIQVDCYWYSFDYNGYSSLFGLLNLSGSFPMGVAHGDDLLYLFELLPLISYEDRKISRRIVDYWANFAYYGNPNGENKSNIWPQYSSENPNFLRMNKEDSVGVDYKAEWKHSADELFSKRSKSDDDDDIDIELHLLTY